MNEQISISENDPISENYNNKLERLKTGIGYNILVNYWNQFQDLHHITVNRMDIFRLWKIHLNPQRHLTNTKCSKNK